MYTSKWGNNSIGRTDIDLIDTANDVAYQMKRSKNALRSTEDTIEWIRKAGLEDEVRKVKYVIPGGEEAVPNRTAKAFETIRESIGEKFLEVVDVPF